MKSNYEQTVDWLYSKLPMFQRSGASAYKKDLGNISALMEHLGNPHKDYKTIHIAGTNGKGSSSHMMASVLQEAGYKTGLTTSPHLKDFRERIRVNGNLCSEEFIIDFVTENAVFIESLGASFFEVSIAMAFTFFSREKVDVAVIETGLGGRLDSTNIIHPDLSLITNIGLDHTGILGNTLQEIAFEKAGIIKPLVPIVIGEAGEEIQNVFIEKAKETGSEIIFAESKTYPEYSTDLKGIYQKKNQRTVLTGIEILRNIGYRIPEEALEKGLQNVVLNTCLRGRWEMLRQNPLVVVDTAHNPHGLAEVRKQIAVTPFENLHLVLGFVNDKDIPSILSYFPFNAQYYFSEPDVPRKLPVSELKKIIAPELNASYFPTVQQALDAALKNASPQDLIYVGGSTFVVAEVI